MIGPRCLHANLTRVVIMFAQNTRNDIPCVICLRACTRLTAPSQITPKECAHRRKSCCSSQRTTITTIAAPPFTPHLPPQNFS